MDRLGKRLWVLLVSDSLPRRRASMTVSTHRHMCYKALRSCMRTISQRELRNDNAEVMRGVEEGETYTVTRRGVPVARLVPLPDETDLRCDRPAKKRPAYASQSRVRAEAPTGVLLRELRGDR